MDDDRAMRHRRWLAGFGFSARDWARIRAHAEAGGLEADGPALDDLDVPVRVGACTPELARRLNGRLLGGWRGRALVWWPMTEREREAWARRRRGR